YCSLATLAWITISSRLSKIRTTVSCQRAFVSKPRRKSLWGYSLRPSHCLASVLLGYPCLSALEWTLKLRTEPKLGELPLTETSAHAPPPRPMRQSPRQ